MDRKIIQVNGIVRHLEYLNNGTFSTVYTCNEEPGIVYCETAICPMKKRLSQLQTKNPHLPQIEHIRTRAGVQLFKMPEYRYFDRRSYPKASEHFDEIEMILDDDVDERELFAYRLDRSLLPILLRKALLKIYDIKQEFGKDCDWDYISHNVAVDNKGRLVLLDIIYSMKAMAEVNGYE